MDAEGFPDEYLVDTSSRLLFHCRSGRELAEVCRALGRTYNFKPNGPTIFEEWTLRFKSTTRSPPAKSYAAHA